MALTDHDTTVGWAEAQEAAARCGVRLVRGIELSTRNLGQSQHLLGYEFDPTNEALVAMLAEGVGSREERIPRTLDRLREHGVDRDEDRVRAGVTTGTIGRNHVADALIAGDHVDNRNEAFEEYLAPGAKAYVPRFAPDVIDAIQVIRDAGGVAVIAHPWGRKTTVSEQRFAELADAGLAGIEVDHMEHGDAAREALRGIADNLGLVATGASDYHGLRKPDHYLGCRRTTPGGVRAAVPAFDHRDFGSIGQCMGTINSDLERFVKAQDDDGTYSRALQEMRAGQKRTHWMWFVFPQIAGLGRSQTSQFFALTDADEARRDAAHPVLGDRLRECARVLVELDESDPVAIFGEVDSLKLQSRMTLFGQTAAEGELFEAVLRKFFDGSRDGETHARL